MDKEKWEKEFEAHYIVGDFGDFYEPTDRVPLAAIKTFIRKTREEARAEVIEEVLTLMGDNPTFEYLKRDVARLSPPDATGV